LEILTMRDLSRSLLTTLLILMLGSIVGAQTTAPSSLPGDVDSQLRQLDLQIDSSLLQLESALIRVRGTPAEEAVEAARQQVQAARARTKAVRERLGATKPTRELLVGPTSPHKTITSALDASVEGDVVSILPGTYRETLFVKTNNITIQAKQPGTVTVLGSDPLTNWKAEAPGVWSTPWAHDFFLGDPDKKQRFHERAEPPVGCAEQVFVDDKPVKQVMTRAEVVDGTFFVDWDTDRLFVDPPGTKEITTRSVEGSTRSRLLYTRHTGGAERVTVRGITFARCANFMQPVNAAVRVGTGWTMEDCTVAWTNGAGIGVNYDNVTLRRVKAIDNGQQGIGGGNCKNYLEEDCANNRNNNKGYPVKWESGSKFAKLDGAIFRRRIARDNQGPGLWLDIENKNILIEGGRYSGSYGADFDGSTGKAINLEINPGPITIRNVTFTDNDTIGLAIQETSNVTVEDCDFVNSELHFRDILDREFKLGSVLIRNNRFTGSTIGTGAGAWKPGDAASKGIVFRNNTHTLIPGVPAARWGGKKFDVLDPILGIGGQ
jgi:hypothetical protein